MAHVFAAAALIDAGKQEDTPFFGLIEDFF
jgi:hypothetical protein